jgi:hypothetical protein
LVTHVLKTFPDGGGECIKRWQHLRVGNEKKFRFMTSEQPLDFSLGMRKVCVCSIL